MPTPFGVVSLLWLSFGLGLVRVVASVLVERRRTRLDMVCIGVRV